ncbi:unnamed protein product [Leptosia nina]|uniref:Integrin beta n=1 Tax=Leptosia nina TaxID=320188 RepID=A0AAV1JN95_9NEOP
MSVLYMFVIFSCAASANVKSCEKQMTCEDCIREPSDCIWCALDSYNATRCMSSLDLDSESDWCAGDRIQPKSDIDVGENQNFSSDTGNVIQIRPQSLKLKLRPGETVYFQFSYKNAKDYPVDLYFLMDASKSMEPIKEKTSNQSENIYRTMKNMTKNVLLGMGTFVDKNTLPYANIINNTLAYSYKNRLRLTESFQDFKEIVKNTESGLNYDTQEGTLDALAQVMVCNNTVGWRKESRKIIIVLTDSSFHAAGDGKYGGIMRPFDGRCYSEDGIYTKELDLDYPSVSLINKLATEEEMTVIFAVDTDHVNDYRALTAAVTGSRYTNYEKKDMVTILSSIYQEITSNLKLRINMKSEYREYFEISFNPDCLSKNDRDCKVKPGEEKEMNGTIKLLKYFSGEHKSIDVIIEGIKEKLTLDIEIIESCNCRSEADSKFCSSRGTKRCGICECNKGSLGDTCQCRGNNINDVSNKTCIPPNSDKVCNGYGECVCGSCMCKERYKGQYCECNEDSCPRGANGHICSSLGECDCGTCRCEQGWSSSDCSCPTSESLCSDGDIICNNRGTCDCGNCTCQLIAAWDARDEQNAHCMILPCASCHSSQCHILETCALCHLNEEECNCDHVNGTTVATINDTTWMECPNLRADVGCYTKFVYRYSETRYGIDLIVQSDLDCAESYYTLGGVIVGVLILLGLLILLAWKCVTDYRDKKEYELFKKELSQSDKSLENPLYESASRTFHNPAFRKRSIY